MLGRIWSLIWKEALQFWRYKLILIFVLAFPVWNLTSAADMVARGVMHIPTAVYDQSNSPASRRLATMLHTSRGFDVTHYAGSQAELEDLLERGTVKVGLVFPRDFAADFERGQAKVQVLLDGSETTTALVARAYLEGLSYYYIRRMAQEETPPWAVLVAALGQQIHVQSRVWFNEDLRREIFQLPAEMAGGLAILAVLLPALTLIREREAGTLEQLLVAPFRSMELVIGKSLLSLAITFLVFIEMLVLIVFYYHVPLRGSLVLLLLLTGYYIFVEMGWGLLISAVARTQGQGFLGAFIIVILEIILSGQILPVEYMPPAAQVAAFLMPNKQYNTIVRGIMLKSYTLAELWLEVVILGLVGAVLYGLVIHYLRRRLN